MQRWQMASSLLGHVGVGLVHVHVGQGRRVGGDVGELAAEGAVEHDADRVDVGSRIGGLTRGLLRGDVLWRAQEGTDLGDGGLGVDLAHQPEVHELGPPLLALTADQEHIAGLDVPVDHAPRVGVPQALAQAVEDAHDALDGHLMPPQHLAEGVALEVLHHQIAVAVLGATIVVDCDDVGVLELTGQGRLTEKARLEVDLVVTRQIGAQHLDRHLASDGLLGGPVDPAASPAPDQLVDAVAVREQQALFEQSRHVGSSTSRRPQGRTTGAASQGGIEASGLPPPRLPHDR
jgi:hypothetical protein